MSMDAEAILHELTHAAGLPIEALQAASAQRTELLPKFLGVIDDYLGLEPAARANSTPIFFIFHLLGEWREKAAYRPLARLLRCSADEADVIFGDATAETSHRIMAGVFDGNPQPLYDIILDPHAEEFIRSRMCEALAMITLRGELDRNLVGPFLRDAFNELQPQRHCYVWYGWQSAIAMLGLGELKVLVKRAFDRGFIDRHLLGFDDFEQDLKHGTERPGEPWRPGDDEYEIFGDTVEELSGWHCFAEHDSEDREEWREPDELEFLLTEPHRNPFKGIETTRVLAAAGRNSRSAACSNGSGYAIGTMSRAADDRTASGSAAGRLVSRSSWTPNWLSRANSPPSAGSHIRCTKRIDELPRWTMPVSTRTGLPSRGNSVTCKASSKVEKPRRSASR